jgi:hypothetical protein
MPLTSFAFIVKGPGYSPCSHTAQLCSEHFSTRVVGVSDFPSAVQAAQQLVLSGVQLIELCGGFTEAQALEMRFQTGNKVPVGVVVYSEEQAKEIERLFT